MSSADDVREMKSITNELADFLVGKSADLKVRAGAVLKAINALSSGEITDNRANEFLRGKARRVDAWEKENAKRQRDELREQARLAREHEHLCWLEAEIARQRATGQGFHGPHVDGLEHLLRVARDAAGAVEAKTRGFQHTGEDQ